MLFWQRGINIGVWIKSRLQNQLEKTISRFKPDPLSSLSVLLQKSIFLAEELHKSSANLMTREEKTLYLKMEQIIENPHDKAILIQMTDQAFRSTNMSCVADQLIHILKKQGIPHFFSRMEQFLLKVFDRLLRN